MFRRDPIFSPSFGLNRAKNSCVQRAGYTASNSSVVVFKFGVRLDKWSISTPTTSFFSL